MIWISVAMAADEGEDDSLVVEAQRQGAESTSASVTVIPVDDRLPASSDVSTVVDSVAGASVQRLGGLGDWAGVSIRGSTLRQVLVVLDGVPLNPDGASAVNLSELPLWAFESVEVYRGNAPPALGSAIGGVVHLRSKSSGGSEVRGAVGSFGTLRLNGSAAATHKSSDVLLVADGFRTNGDYTYFSDNGTTYNLDDDDLLLRQNNQKQQLNAHLRLRAGSDRSRWTLLQAFVDRQEGLAGNANTPTTVAHLHTQRSLTALDLDLGGVPWRGRILTWGLVRGEAFDDPLGEIGTGLQDNQDVFASLGGMGHLEWLPRDNLKSGVTASVRRDVVRLEDQVLDQTVQAHRLAVQPGLHADWLLWQDRLILSPVVQATWLGNPGEQTAVTGLNPRFGALFEATEHGSLRFNIGRYLRPPDLTELYGDRGAVVGNPNLVPEKGMQTDLGARWGVAMPKDIDGSFDVGVFHNEVTDMIVMVQNAQSTLVPLNLDQGRIMGVEAAVGVTGDWFELQHTLTANHSLNLGDEEQSRGNQLPRVPTLSVFQRTAWIHQGLRVGHTFSHTDGNYWDRTNFYRAPPRSFHGAFVRLDPAGWPSVELDVLNIGDAISEWVPRNPLNPSDEAEVEQAITDFVGYPLPGRTVLLTVRWQPRKDH